MTDIVARFPKVYKPLDDPWRYKVMYGGRAAARSWSIARKLLIAGTQRPLFILCSRELQKSIRQSVHKLLKSQILLLGLDNFYEVLEQSIKGVNGTEFMFLGIKANPEEIRSTEGIDIAWLEEAHSISESSWDIIDPTVRKPDSEIWISFNTRFKSDYIYQKFVLDTPPDNALVLKTSYEDNPYFPEVLRAQMDLMKSQSYEKYLHIWEGELKKLAEGAIFGRQISEVRKSGRLTFVPIQPNCEVLTFMDLGKNDETAIWFMQRVGMEYRFIDYFEGRLEEISYYTRFIKSLDYNYGKHYLPHDADHERLGMTRNIKQQFMDGGIKPITIVPRVAHKNTAIELGREMLARCWFHHNNDDKPDEQCEGYVSWLPDNRMNTRAKRADIGFDRLCNYRYRYNEDDKVYHFTPHHDRASNGADAYLQMAQSNMQLANNSKYDDFSVSING